jgi:hypothetical protein
MFVVDGSLLCVVNMLQLRITIEGKIIISLDKKLTMYEKCLLLKSSNTNIRKKLTLY